MTGKPSHPWALPSARLSKISSFYFSNPIKTVCKPEPEILNISMSTNFQPLRDQQIANLATARKEIDMN